MRVSISEDNLEFFEALASPVRLKIIGCLSKRSMNIKELAEKSDCVIVGRCASYILRDMEHMMSAFVYADQESRVNRAVSEYSVDPRRAEATLRKSDRRRETFYSINTGGNWYDKENYTLCLNSGALGIPLCADIIVSAAQKTIFV